MANALAEERARHSWDMLFVNSDNGPDGLKMYRFFQFLQDNAIEFKFLVKVCICF